jgi:hypothetical protein
MTMTTPSDDGVELGTTADWIEVRAGDGSVTRLPELPDLSRIEAGMREMNEVFGRMAERLEALPRFEVPRGGIRYDLESGIRGIRRQDPRKGEEVYVYDLLPGARVYVLEDVFTVDRVDMDAPLPTVWLKELPTSPLYFSEDEYIYLANETED